MFAGLQDFRVLQIRDLKPLHLVLVYRSIALLSQKELRWGIVDSVRGDELGELHRNPWYKQAPICRGMPLHSQQRPNDN